MSARFADVMMALAGHLSDTKRRHYVHLRDRAEKKAVAALPGTALYRAPAEKWWPQNSEPQPPIPSRAGTQDLDTMDINRISNRL